MKRYQNDRDASLKQSWWKGTLAGFMGAIPMTIFMLATQRFLPEGQRYDLPPEIITKELTSRAHVRWRMNKTQILITTLIAHLSYSAAVGTLYVPFERKKSLPTLVQGAVFGLLVWAGSYLIALPLLGMSERGQREPLKRNLMMIAAHIVWGSATGATLAALMHKNR